MIENIRSLSRTPGGYILLLAFLCGVAPIELTAQQITVHTVSAPINSLSLTDVDFIHSATPQWLFSVDVAAPGGRTVSVCARVTLDVTLATGEHWGDALILVTKTFAITGSRTFTNLDIGKGKAIQDSSLVWNQDAKNKFLDVALPSGQMPAGKYTFLVEILDPSTGSVLGTTPPNEDIQFILTNPTSVELLFPNDADTHVSQLPLFQWVFDGTRSKISIYELLPGQSSLEEATQGVPILTQEVPSTSFQYPSGGVRSLQAGHAYVWYVEGEVLALGGKSTLLKSPLRSFTVEAGPSAASSLLDEVESSLDPKYKPLFDQIRAEGLTPTGTMRVNGAAIQVNELLEILKYLRMHPDAVQTAGIQ